MENCNKEKKKKTIFEEIYENYKTNATDFKELEIKNNKKKTFLKVMKPLKKKFERKKGRKLKDDATELDSDERIHSRLNSDNIKRKIKTHFHCFIISFLNLMIKKEWEGNQKFKLKKMDSEITQNITIAYNRKLLNTPIKEILKKVSNKFNDHLSNEKILSKIPPSKDEINHLLNCTYKEMYEKYYLTSRNELFKNEKENNSFEYHLSKIKNKFGNEYMEKYKNNAENFVDFFQNGKMRKKKSNSSFYKENENSEINNINSNNLTNKNTISDNPIVFLTKCVEEKNN